MRLDRFDLNLLVVFEAVYSEGNLTRAAEQLNVAQPTVSNAMTRLRTAFDDPLFVRAGRGVAPTPMARRMITPVRSALRQMQTTLDGNLSFDAASMDRTFNISIGEIPATTLLPALVDLLKTQAPGVKVRAFQVSRREIKDQLGIGALDIAIDIPRLSTHVLGSTPLLTDGYVCTLRRGHPLSKGRLTPERFAQLQFVVVSSRPTGSSLLELASNRFGIKTEAVLRTQYYLPAMRIVETSDFALVAPRSLASQFDVVIKPLPADLEMEGMWMYWHRSSEEDPANQWIREQIQSVWQSLSATSADV